MCGIFGFSYKEKSNQSFVTPVLHDLFMLSESRGKEASGIATLQDGHLEILRAGYRSSKLLKTEEYRALMQRYRHSSPNVFIGNTRLATNGIQSIETNNQPVVTHSAVGIHNGMIVNDEALWKKYRQLRREFDVDTEILLKLVEHFVSKGFSLQEAVSTVYKEIEGAASIGLMHTCFPEIIVATNTGSLYFMFVPNSFFIFASEEYYLQYLRTKYPLFQNQTSIYQVKPGEGLSFNFYSFELNKFQLGKRFYSSRLKKQQKLFSLSMHTVRFSFEQRSNMFLNKIADLETHVPNYDAINRLKRCTKCILPETMPLISFDEKGVCNYCRTSRPISYQGEKVLKKFIQRYRTTTGKADCIVALSGGRDSSYGLHYMKNVLGMRPIAYTYDWGMVTTIARRNQYRLTAQMGIEHIIVSADLSKKRDNIKKNIEAWLNKPNLAMVPLFMAGDKQAEYYAEQIKQKTGIQLMIYCRGNELEDERFKFGYYGIFNGTPGGVLHNLSWMGKVQMAAYYAKEYILNPAYINSSVIDTSFAYFSAYLMRHKFLYLWHYVPWDEKTIVSTLKNQYKWESATDTVATWRIDDGTPPFYNYIYYKVQGFTEHDGLRSNQIRQGVINRAEALSLVREENKPRYESMKWYFDILKIDANKVLSAIDLIPTRY